MPYFRPDDIPDLDELHEALFFLAASGDDVESFSRLIDAGVDPNAPDIYNETPILRALQENSMGVFELLLQRNIPLPSRAVSEIAGRGYVQMLRRLVDLGFTVNERDAQSWTPIMSAAVVGQSEEVELLIKAGASVNDVDSNGMTPLHHAATSGSTDVIQILLQFGARSDALDRNGCRPAYWARENGHDAAAHLLDEADSKSAS